MHHSTHPLSRQSRRTRATIWALVLVAVGITAMPLTAYVWTTVAQAQEAGTQETGAQKAGTQAVGAQREQPQGDTNPRADYWREVRSSQQGYTAVVGPETDVLIQSRGQLWREVRNGPTTTLAAVLVIGIILAFTIYHLIKGGFKLEHRTGRKVLRWVISDRVLHWYTAVLFILLAITGLSLLWGRAVLIPVIGKQAFGAWAEIAKPVHDYLSLPFVAGLVVMLIKWFNHNIPASYDWQWIKQMGGYLGGGHPPAGFVNAGEKAYYWTLFIVGGALVISGFFLLFPNFGFDRAAMQNANIVHGISAGILTAFACLHIYLGTLGSEGVFEGMVTGEVDEGWARQHHPLWLEEISEGKAAGQSPRRTDSDESTAASPG